MQKAKHELAQRAAELVSSCADFVKQLEQERDCLDVINEIMGLALTSSDYVHIHINYSPHVGEFSVYVLPSSTKYESAKHERIYSESVYLDRVRIDDEASPLDQLLVIEDKLLEIIAAEKPLLEYLD